MPKPSLLSVRSLRHGYAACALALALSSCATEVESLTDIGASLESAPGLAPVQFSHLARQGSTASHDLLEIQLDGKPISFSSTRPLSINTSESMVSTYLPPATGRFEFVRAGKIVATSEPVKLAVDRFNYVILYGDQSAPEVLVLTAQREARRLNVANVRPDKQDIEVALLDDAEVALGEPARIAYGQTWSQLPSPEAAFVLVSAGDAGTDMLIGCNPNIALVSFDEPGEANSGIGLLAPTEPGSPDSAAEACHDPSCNCD